MATNPLKTTLDYANPDTLNDQFRKLKIGAILRGQIPQMLRKHAAPVVDAGAPVATVETLVLPDDAKASSIQRCYVRTGGVTGEFTSAAIGVTPLTTQVSVQPNGDIMFLAADAVTSFDIHYLPTRGDVVTLLLPVITDVLTIPASYTARGVVLLLDATSTIGGVTGRMRVMAPGAVVAAGEAALDVPLATVNFAAADAVTQASVRLLVVPEAELDTLLEGESQFI